MDAFCRIFVCLPTLVDLLLEPGWDNLFKDIDQRKRAVDALERLAASKRITIYAPPPLVTAIPMLIARTCRQVDSAAISVHRLLDLVESNLTVDYKQVLSRANSATSSLDGADLYDIVCLVCAEELQASAFVARRPDTFQQIVERNSTFDDFTVPIMDLETFISNVDVAPRNL